MAGNPSAAQSSAESPHCRACAIQGPRRKGWCHWCNMPEAGCQNPRNLSLCSVYPCEKSKETFLFFNLEFKLELELELGWKLEWLEGVSKTLGRLVYFVPYLYRGRSPLYNYNTKYTSLPRFFDTPSIHSNLLQMLQKKKNFYNTSKVDLSLKTSCWIVPYTYLYGKSKCYPWEGRRNCICMRFNNLS